MKHNLANIILIFFLSVYTGYSIELGGDSTPLSSVAKSPAALMTGNAAVGGNSGAASIEINPAGLGLLEQNGAGVGLRSWIGGMHIISGGFYKQLSDLGTGAGIACQLDYSDFPSELKQVIDAGGSRLDGLELQTSALNAAAAFGMQLPFHKPLAVGASVSIYRQNLGDDLRRLGISASLGLSYRLELPVMDILIGVNLKNLLAKSTAAKIFIPGTTVRLFKRLDIMAAGEVSTEKIFYLNSAVSFAFDLKKVSLIPVISLRNGFGLNAYGGSMSGGIAVQTENIRVDLVLSLANRIGESAFYEPLYGASLSYIWGSKNEQ